MSQQLKLFLIRAHNRIARAMPWHTTYQQKKREPENPAPCTENAATCSTGGIQKKQIVSFPACSPVVLVLSCRRPVNRKDLKNIVKAGEIAASEQ